MLTDPHDPECVGDVPVPTQVEGLPEWSPGLRRFAGPPSSARVRAVGSRCRVTGLEDDSNGQPAREAREQRVEGAADGPFG